MRCCVLMQPLGYPSRFAPSPWAGFVTLLSWSCLSEPSPRSPLCGEGLRRQHLPSSWTWWSLAPLSAIVWDTRGHFADDVAAALGVVAQGMALLLVRCASGATSWHALNLHMHRRPRMFHGFRSAPEPPCGASERHSVLEVPTPSLRGWIRSRHLLTINALACQEDGNSMDFVSTGWYMYTMTGPSDLMAGHLMQHRSGQRLIIVSRVGCAFLP